MSLESLKKEAAEKAVEQVKDGMVLALGTGSTARYAIIKIGELWQAGALKEIVGIPTSEGTASLARDYDIPLGQLHQYDQIDLAIDGADEVAPDFNLIKGLGGALLREKMIEIIAAHFIVVVDETKLVQKLGARGPLPVEVTQFAWQAHARWLQRLGCRPELRGGENRPYLTDNGNYILDCTFPNGIDHPAELGVILCSRPGIIEHGLFLDMADEVIVAGKTGLQVLRRAEQRHVTSQ
jgi:ribose 5-phosphate isomerase A